MKIQIKSVFGKSYDLDVDSNQTIGSLKLWIQEKVGFFVENQRLLFQMKHLLDDCTLEDYKIPNEATLLLLIKGKQYFKIFVKIAPSDNNTRTLYQLDGSETILNLKQKMQDLDGIPVSMQRLTFANNDLEDDKTMRDYNIQSDATLFLYLRDDIVDV
ncbi:MAG: putative Polyubiquitin [Streblomastix strix]|uniref:Putative Polyubiquitin n=1 Tax=Streblomastix strix TaxID=222440 RepID=A0A5J4W5D2_9EUKA|nr:MAG: putative Polyubiquitin [Streblomastix strix]